MKLKDLINEWVLEGFSILDEMETQHFELNELNIDSLNSYDYEEINKSPYTKTYTFNDRCGNKLVVAYIEKFGEFKSGYEVEGVNGLIFDPTKLPSDHPTLGDLRLKPCVDDKKVNTIYKILLEEIIPKYLLNKKPNKIWFNPVSDSRKRLVQIIMNKINKIYPQLIISGDYLINK